MILDVGSDVSDWMSKSYEEYFPQLWIFNRIFAAFPWAFVFMFKKWKFDRNVFLFESCKCKTFQHLGQMSKMSDDGSVFITS